MREVFMVFAGVLFFMLGIGVSIIGIVLIQEQPTSIGNWGVFCGGNLMFVLSLLIIRNWPRRNAKSSN